MPRIIELINDNPAPAKVSVASLAIGDGFIYNGQVIQKTSDTSVFNETTREANTVSAFGSELVEPKDLHIHYSTPVA